MRLNGLLLRTAVSGDGMADDPRSAFYFPARLGRLSSDRASEMADWCTPEAAHL